jgi:hypothetical protein
MHTLRSFMIVTVSLAGLSACGQSDGGGPARYSSGVDPNKDVATLNATEAQQVCSSVNAYVNAQLDFDAIAYVACIPGAVWTTITVEACEKKLTDCMALFPKPIAVSGTVTGQAALPDLGCLTSIAQCQTTVAQLEGCVDVSLDRALSVLDWSCDLAASSSTRMVAEPKPDARVCTDINAACNDVAAPVAPGPE